VVSKRYRSRSCSDSDTLHPSILTRPATHNQQILHNKQMSQEQKMCHLFFCTYGWTTHMRAHTHIIMHLDVNITAAW